MTIYSIRLRCTALADAILLWSHENKPADDYNRVKVMQELDEMQRVCNRALEAMRRHPDRGPLGIEIGRDEMEADAHAS